MEQPAALRRIKHPQVHKPDQFSRSASTKVESAAATTTLKSHNKQQPYHQPVHQDGQIINSSSSSKQLINKSQVWDCGSTLYDSFELNSFNLHLDKAINSSSFRTLSMPHLPDRRAPLPHLEPPLPVMTITKHQPVPKKFNKFSKSFHKFLRSVFGSSNTINQGRRSQESKLYRDVNHTPASDPFTKPPKKSVERKKDSFYVYDGSMSMRVLTTIPEIQEIDGQPKFSPDATPAVRRAVSERFTAAATVLV